MQNDMRDRLIDLLEKAEGQVNNDVPSLEMIANYLIANGVILPQWISVDDRLPEKNGRYLTTVCNYKGEVDVFDLWYDNTDWLIDEGDDSYEYEVTHWMLLPEPPKPNRS